MNETFFSSSTWGSINHWSIWKGSRFRIKHGDLRRKNLLLSRFLFMNYSPFIAFLLIAFFFTLCRLSTFFSVIIWCYLSLYDSSSISSCVSGNSWCCGSSLTWVISCNSITFSCSRSVFFWLLFRTCSLWNWVSLGMRSLSGCGRCCCGIPRLINRDISCLSWISCFIFLEWSASYCRIFISNFIWTELSIYFLC